MTNISRVKDKRKMLRKITRKNINRTKNNNKQNATFYVYFGGIIPYFTPFITGNVHITNGK